MGLLKEISELYRFIRKTTDEEKNIIFYSEHEGYYPNFEGIIEELTGRHELSLCYVTSDRNDPILQTPQPRIKPFYFKTLLPYFMGLVNCRVFVMTMTDLNQFHLKRSADPVHYVYVFHSLVSTHMLYRRGAFDHYDTILCAGTHHVKEIRRQEELCNLPKKELVEAGYYRLERIYEAYRKYSSRRPSPSGRRTILIAPSWGKENVLESCGERLIDLLSDAGYEVIVRPHPETVRRFPKLLSRLESKCGDGRRGTLEKTIVTDDSLLLADVLITDWSGIALEYAFGTERPVLFLDVPIKVRNDRYEELGIEPLFSLRSRFGVVVSPAELENVPSVISGMIRNKDAYTKDIIELRGQIVYAFGRSSEISARHIANLALNKNS